MAPGDLIVATRRARDVIRVLIECDWSASMPYGTGVDAETLVMSHLITPRGHDVLWTARSAS